MILFIAAVFLGTKVCMTWTMYYSTVKVEMHNT